MSLLPQNVCAEVFEHVPLSVFVVASDGRIHFVNAFAAETIGRPRADIVGSSMDAYVYGEAGRRTWPDVQAELHARAACSQRMYLVREDGREVDCELHGVVVGGPDGVGWLVLIFRDVAAEARGALTVNKTNIQMAKMNAELMRANAELRRVSELKSNFLSVASHELKTPLTSIKGYSDIIIDTMKDKLEPGVYSMVASINRGADRLHRVVNNILDATRIEKRKLRLNPEDIDLVETIRESIDELEQVSKQRNIAFVFDPPPALPRFLGDRMRMQQVFVNLFTNALKYSPDGSIVVVLLELEEGERFHITVRDQGIGIPIEEQRRIFQPFYEIGGVATHGGGPAKLTGGGTGLGLSIVKGIVERHGGFVSVHSDGMSEGAYPGADFHVVVPVRPAIPWDDDATREESAKIAGPAALKQPVEAPRPERRMAAVLIDPDREAIGAARVALEASFTVHATNDPCEGLALAFEERADLVLIERVLGTLDGCRVCRILRSQDETAGAAIAFYSEMVSEVEVHQCFVCGADEYLTKPLGARELADKAVSLVRKRRKSLEHRLR